MENVLAKARASTIGADSEENPGRPEFSSTAELRIVICPLARHGRTCWLPRSVRNPARSKGQHLQQEPPLLLCPCAESRDRPGNRKQNECRSVCLPTRQAGFSEYGQRPSSL